MMRRFVLNDLVVNLLATLLVKSVLCICFDAIFGTQAFRAIYTAAYELLSCNDPS